MLEKMPVVFTIRDVCKVVFYKNPAAYSVYIHRLKKAGKITEIERGKYTLQKDPYTIASNIIIPSYISFWTASYLFGYTEQVVTTIQIACSVSKQLISFMNQKIEFIKLPNELMFGFKRDKNGMFIATPEKLVIDCLHYPKHIGGFDEIIKIIDQASLNRDILLDYLSQIKSIRTIRKVGCMLDVYKNIDLFEDIHSRLKHDKNYVTLREHGKINKKWKVIL